MKMDKLRRAQFPVEIEGCAKLVSRRTIAALALTAVVITAVVTAVTVYYVLRIRGHGRIKTIGVSAYADPDCTKLVSEIDWGTLPAGGLSQTTLYLKNTGNYPVNLTLSTENWDPSRAKQYMSLGWDYCGDSLAPGEVCAVILTLSVEPEVSGVTDFSFDITIRAAG